jgi:hypothetical protein
MTCECGFSRPADIRTSGTFNFSSQSNPNYYDPSRPNDVFRTSYNMAPGGGRENTSDASLGLEWETHYALNSADRVFELHLNYVGLDNASYRPWTWLFYKSSTAPWLVNRIEHNILIDKMSFLSQDAQNQWMIFQPNGNLPNAGGQITLVGPTVFEISQNNYVLFYQRGSDGYFHPLFYLDNNNRLRLGAFGDPVSLSRELLWEQDNSYDIGTPQDNRPRNLYLDGSAVINGAVGVGVPSPAYPLHVNGSVAGVGPYVNLSDARYKKNIAPLACA